jgi:hypothetical protein
VARLSNGTLTVPAPAAPPTGPTSWIQRSASPAEPPRVERPEPRLRQLMGVCGWAAVLGGIGLVIGVRGLIGILADEPPAWYEPSAIVTGGLGIALTVGAFLTVHRSRAPWLMLGGSSVSLVAAMVLTSYAF